MSEPTIISSASRMREWANDHRRAGRRIALVPTMGFLHEGHLSLVREAARRADVTVVSIFVNPTQFGPNEDLATYPRDLEGDIAKLADLNVDAVFTPTPDIVYPAGFDTYVVPDTLARPLCGVSRPHHFRGVATVVLILLRLTRCQVAIFGNKDYQQLQIIRHMSADLWLDVEIIGAPIVRERDGLAMSSRNAYLSTDERKQALVLSQALDDAERLVKNGERDARRVLESVRTIIGCAPNARIDYTEVVDAKSLSPTETILRPAACMLAVFIGKTRLIDNRTLTPRASQ
ncbi:MAG: pantoate--beta-alanine ligase [Deltaproteobacteria bacterium RIFOXYA12_FULL_58_15]|nr:MAG: pantoate--beta-alanine ligase [Deltaproteobacteria bacterium RIFOXYA12_FULL_58_15]OGR08513.1 MAG: pantoate--beta-alanine ligase [Deltaproteobacteria bacterium RIFOXYB12_FULL_58_9]